MEDLTSTPAAQGGLPAPPTAATRPAGAVYHREQDWRLRIDTMDDTWAPSSTFPVSASATRAISGGARPPRPSVDPPAKKKRSLFIAPHPRSRAPPPSCNPQPLPTALPPGGELPRRQEAPSQLLNGDPDSSGFHSSWLQATASAAPWTPAAQLQHHHHHPGISGTPSQHSSTGPRRPTTLLRCTHCRVSVK